MVFSAIARQRMARFAKAEAEMAKVETVIPAEKVATAVIESLPDGFTAEFKAPRRRRVARALKRAPIRLFRMLWGGVVLGLDLIADVVAGAGRTIALFTTPVMWALDNALALPVRAAVGTWRFFRPKANIPPGLVNFARYYTLLEEASTSTLFWGMISLLPSWLFQFVSSGSRVNHLARKMAVYEDAITLDPFSAQAEMSRANHEKARDRLIEMQRKLAVAEGQVETKKVAAKTTKKKGVKAEVKPKKLTKAQFAAKLRRDGWTEVQPRVEVDVTKMRELQRDRRAWFEAFGHYNIDVARVDAWGRVWAVPPKGQSLMSAVEESVTEPTAAERIPLTEEVRKVLNKLDHDSAKWDKTKDPATRSRLYGQNCAVEAVSKDRKVLTNRKACDKVWAALRAEVLPRDSGFATPQVKRGFDYAIKEMREALAKQPATA